MVNSPSTKQGGTRARIRSLPKNISLLLFEECTGRVVESPSRGDFPGLGRQRQVDSDITAILVEWKRGDATALDRLTPLVYDELLRMARLRIGGESRDVTMQPTTLVHEAYLKLIDHTRLPWQNRSHFFAIAATVMRRILIDDARRRNAEKRGGGVKITLNEEMDAPDEKQADVMALDLALQSLASIDERKSRIIELKYFGGMTTEEISEVMGISVATVGRELRVGQAWLHRELAGRSAE
jgi:RNA polymerase sigma-70 factor, ECF subfamily